MVFFEVARIGRMETARNRNMALGAEGICEVRLMALNPLNALRLAHTSISMKRAVSKIITEGYKEVNVIKHTNGVVTGYGREPASQVTFRVNASLRRTLVKIR